MYGAEILFRKNEFDFKDIVKIAKKNPFHKISKCIITNFTIYRFLPIIKKKISFKDNTIFDYRPSPIPTQWQASITFDTTKTFVLDDSPTSQGLKGQTQISLKLSLFSSLRWGGLGGGHVTIECLRLCHNTQAPGKESNECCENVFKCALQHRKILSLDFNNPPLQDELYK